MLISQVYYFCVWYHSLSFHYLVTLLQGVQGQGGCEGKVLHCEVVMAPSLIERKGVWTMLSDIGFDFWVVLCGARSWSQ